MEVWIECMVGLVLKRIANILKIYGHHVAQSTESGAQTQIINRIKTAFNVEFDPSDKNNRHIIQKYANVRDEYVY